MSRFFRLLVTLITLAAATPAAAERYTWKGPFGDWSTASNWTPAGVPTSVDTAVINGGIVTLSAPAEVLRLELNGGTLTRDAELTVQGGFIWKGGSLKGSGALTLTQAAQSEIIGGSASSIGPGPVNNAGVLVWSSGNFALGGNAEFNNTGLFEARSDGIMLSAYGFSFNNSGTFRKTQGAGTTEIRAGGNFNNKETGLVQVLSGTLAFSNGESSGHFEAAAGTKLRISGTAVLTEASSLVTEGDLDFASATRLYVKGSVDVAGEATISGGEAHLLGNVSRLGSIRTTGGTLYVSTNAFTVPSVYVLGGALDGTASLTVTNTFHWAGGSLKGTGTLITAPGSQAEIAGSAPMGMNQRVLTLRGTTVWTSTSYIAMGGGAQIQNEGTLEVSGKGSITRNMYSSGQSDFSNAGTFTLASSGDFTLQGIGFNNDGLVRLESGALRIGRGFSSGRFESSPAAELSISQWWFHELTGGASLDLQGPLSITDSTELRISQPIELPGQVVINGGTLAANSVVKLTGKLDWLAGNLGGTGTLVIESGAVVNQKGTASLGLKGTVDNRGSILLEGAAPINMGGTVVNNTGLLEFRADARLSGHNTVFNNLPGGMLRKAAGAGKASFTNVRVNNQGTIEALSGDLAFDAQYPYGYDSFYQQGGATLLKGGTVSAFSHNSGRLPLRMRLHIEGGLLGGYGTVQAHVVSAGTVRPGVDEQTPGALKIDGTYTQEAAGALRIGIGGNAPGTSYGRLDVTGDTKLAGALALVQLRGYVPVPGEALTPVRWLNGIRNGDFGTVSGQDFGPEAYMLFKYTATDLTVYNSRASLADVDVEVTGPGAARPGLPVDYYLRIRNNNSVPMVVPVVLRLGRHAMLDMSPFEGSGDTYQDLVDNLLPGTPVPPPPGPGEEYPSLKRYFPSSDGNDYLVPLWVVVPAGGTYEQKIKTGCGAGVSLDMGKPFDPNQFSNCLFAASGMILEFVPGYDCMKFAMTGLSALANKHTTGKAINVSATLASMAFSLIQCAGDLIPPTKVIKVLIKVNDILGKVAAVDGFLDECKPFFKPLDKAGGGKAACVSSRDPNDKVGPVGYTAAHDITGAGKLNYTIFFENDPAATAPAQTVVVTDTLDATALDFSTFSFGTFTWGSTTVMAPAGSKTFTKDVDMRPAMNLIVRVEAGLNELSGVITWRFTSLDPATQEPTQDPLAGFLPPNKIKPEGQGTLTYSVMAKPNLVNGTTFGSGARIIFDTNEPIDTQPWTNRIDTQGPESQVLPLSLDSQGRIVVTWSGTDTGAGVKDYTLFVSVDGGEYTPWLSNTTDTTALYEGDVAQHHYAFYSVARDMLDHVEAAPNEPDATSDGLGVPPVCPPESLGSPTLMLNGSSQMTLECGQSTWSDPGATAQDGCGFPLEVHRYNSGQDPYGPGPNTSAEGSYSVQYIAWDASGATVSAIRTVHVDDRTAPTLTLKGPAHMTHTCGTGWVDPGVEATDACYGDVSATVSKSGYVNGWVEGQYTVTYSVTDSGGNSAPAVSRTVEVVNCPW
jgi:hypothetical protein